MNTLGSNYLFDWAHLRHVDRHRLMHFTRDSYRLFGWVIFFVLLIHMTLAIFFHVDIRLVSQPKSPDLEIELATNVQPVGNSNSTNLSQKSQVANVKKQSSKTPTQNDKKSSEVETSRSASSDLPGERASGAGGPAASSVAQLAGGVPSSSDNQSPKLLSNVKPKYPNEAFINKQEGVVILYVQVLETGAVGQVKVKNSSGSEALDESAVEAVKEWKFSPGKAKGKITAQWIKVPILFSLKNR